MIINGRCFICLVWNVLFGKVCTFSFISGNILPPLPLTFKHTVVVKVIFFWQTSYGMQAHIMLNYYYTDGNVQPYKTAQITTKPTWVQVFTTIVSFLLYSLLHFLKFYINFYDLRSRGEVVVSFSSSLILLQFYLNWQIKVKLLIWVVNLLVMEVKLQLSLLCRYLPFCLHYYTFTILCGLSATTRMNTLSWRLFHGYANKVHREANQISELSSLSLPSFSYLGLTTSFLWGLIRTW